eukprot:SAG11_NODE_1082_length_5952_cov_2.529301_4_plen_285_part_00
MIPDEARRSFEEQGYAVLRGALSQDTVEELHTVLARLEDPANLPAGETVFYNTEEERGAGDGSELTFFGDHQLRLNNLQRRDVAFHQLLDHPAVLPFIDEYMREPRFVGDWYIRKEPGPRSSWWHRGHDPLDGLLPVAQHEKGKLATKHLNVAWLLDDQASGEGCLLVWPGSHQIEGDFLTMNAASYETPGLALEGSIEVEGKAGDCVVFTEALVHCGDEKLRGPSRRNLYTLYTDGAAEPEEQKVAARVSARTADGPVGELWKLLRSEPARRLCGLSDVKPRL